MNKLNVSQTHDSKRTLDLDQSIPLIRNLIEKLFIFLMFTTQNFVYIYINTLNRKYTLSNTQTQKFTRKIHERDGGKFASTALFAY